jgi:uncharacterized protein YbjT (DUF2867 family)
VVSLVGLLYGSPKQFEDVQWKGAENVARAARDAGAKLIHFSAIGADANSRIPYVRTKGLGEAAVLDACPNATIIRPSIVFGPGDSFFNVSILVSFLILVSLTLLRNSDLPVWRNFFLSYLSLMGEDLIFSLFLWVTSPVWWKLSRGTTTVSTKPWRERL